MHPPPSFPFAVLQYAFLALIAYVLAGAPLLAGWMGAGTEDAQHRVGAAGAQVDGLVVPDANLTCDAHAFRGVHVLSREPLVVYIEGFLSDEEATAVVELSTPLFQPSTIWAAGEERLDTAVRQSSKAPVPRAHAVQCIEARARAFQGWRPFVFVEKLWAQRYGPGGHYTYHYDWASASATHGRVSSFMVWLGGECTGGGTHFPRLRRPAGDEWCRFVDCGDEREGVVFKPARGNAVFWENLRADGSGYAESWHAGLPVLSGEKIGLNIWSWFQDGYVP